MIQVYPTVAEIVATLRGIKDHRSFREYVDKYLIDPYEVHVPTKLRADITGIIYHALNSGGAIEPDAKPDDTEDAYDPEQVFNVDSLPLGSKAVVVMFKGRSLSSYADVVSDQIGTVVLKTTEGCFTLEGMYPGCRFENNLYGFKIIS